MRVKRRGTELFNILFTMILNNAICTPWPVAPPLVLPVPTGRGKAHSCRRDFVWVMNAISRHCLIGGETDSGYVKNSKSKHPLIHTHLIIFNHIYIFCKKIYLYLHADIYIYIYVVVPGNMGYHLAMVMAAPTNPRVPTWRQTKTQ